MKKTVKGLILAMSCTALLAACSSKEEDKTPVSGTNSNTIEQKSIEIYGVRDAQISSQQIIADKLGYFKEEGLDVKNTLIESGPDIAPLVASGSAPISIQTNFMDIILTSSGVDVKIVAPLAQIAGTQAVVAAPGVVIKEPKDLEGLTFGIPAGADVQIAINKMAELYDVDLSKIKVANLAPSDAVTALQSGSIDAMAAWEPFITKGVAAGGSFLFSGTLNDLNGSAEAVDWMSVHTTLQVTDDYLAKNPNTIKAILRALEKATTYINENREEAIKLLAPELHLEEEELTEIMNRNVYSMLADDTFINGSNGKTTTDYLLSVGNIDAVPDQKDYIDLSLLKSVNASLVTAEVK